ncbi:unnamed protein product, partial [Prorocentrum cordatum]
MGTRPRGKAVAAAQGGGTVLPGPKAPAWGCSCGEAANWASRLHCRSCGAPAPVSVRQRAVEAAAGPPPLTARPPWAAAPKAKVGAKAGVKAEAAAAGAPWVHGGGKPRRVRFREAEVVEIEEDGEVDQLAAALRLLEGRGVQLEADPGKAAPEAPKSHHAAVQSAMWKVKNAAGKRERAQRNLEAAQGALADAQLAADKAAEAKEAAAKAQLDQGAQDVDRLAQATLGARYAAELKDHFEGEEAVQATQAIELFSKLAASCKARIEAAAKRAAE